MSKLDTTRVAVLGDGLAAGMKNFSLTFSGLGTWSGDATRQLHVASVQISTSGERPYVTILIDGGVTSNVDTKPEDITLTLP